MTEKSPNHNAKLKKKPGPKPGSFAKKNGLHVAQAVAERLAKPPRKPRSDRKTLDAQKFAAEWIANGGNGAKAYLATINPNVQKNQAGAAASKLLQRPEVQAEIRKLRENIAAADAFRLERFRLTRADVLARLAMLAVAELPDAFGVDEQTGRPILKPFAEMPTELRSALAEVSIGQGGRMNAKVYDKQAALMNYAKLQGWLVDQQQYLGADGQPTNPGGATFVLTIQRDGPERIVDAEPVQPEREASRELDRRLNALR